MLSGRDLVNETARAIAFLSRIPVSDRHFANHDGNLSKTVAAFPLAGLLITLPAALLLGILALADAPPLVAVLTALGLQMLVTGALHEDGLTDTADGLGGGRDRDRALTIMKDSRIGTYGALALILSVALRTAALAALLPVWPALAIPLAWLASAAASRAAMVWHWSSLPPAKADGVAASVGQPDPASTRFAIGCGLTAPILLGLLVLPFAAVFTSLIVSGVLTAGFTAYVRSKIRGHTGDTIGATQQVAEIGFLASLAIFL
ncbi:adenosylcobinamide-GDP ribazoletransferase [Rhizobium glycinendophyticum]|uniref:Adenosylcobinamide-GDP ribazoletransferase n=1 Tax=Rhizobium glycinendophyticum TaxID=2589807 RepID=A0A504UA28_9HYPH|nr:adenosylcobinamide-GDP ribazoletransferase [Rhizobium glycinendophyticum]TPP11369.1 adenosylcobinamide-GDP ribazoletransferase [Rhizobium glycinendophyticum]